MTAETDIKPRLSAVATARAWRALELSPQLRHGVEVAAKAAGIEPETWLARALLAAAPSPPEPPAPATPPPPVAPRRDSEVVRALSTLLSVARDRAPERVADEPVPVETPSQRVEPAPVEAPPQPAALGSRHVPVLGPSERSPETSQLPTLYYAPPPQPQRHILALTLLTITVGVAFGAGAFYIRYGGTPPTPPLAITAALPPTPQAPPPSPPKDAPSVPEPPQAAAPAPQSAALPSPAEAPSPAVAPSPGPTAVPQPDTAAPAAAPPASATAVAPAPLGPRAQPQAPQSNPIDDYNLGVRYAFGNGVKQDYAKAAELFQRAAKQGLADAQYNLGALYENGLGVTKDPVRAVLWYHSAAEQRHASAELSLGLAYANGTGVPQDYAEAAGWFRRAAEQGVVTAQYNLGALYVNGFGVEKSLVDAFAWFSMAAAAGDAEARDQMQRAADLMSPQQLRTARAMVAKLSEALNRPAPPGAPPAAPAAAQPAGAADPASVTANAPTADKAMVSEIQRYLLRLHYDTGSANGIVGDKTVAAIRQYQTDQGLTVDGEPNRPLLFRLKADVERLQKR